MAYPPRNVQMVSVTEIAYSPLKEWGAGRLRLPASSKLQLFFIRFHPVQDARVDSSGIIIIVNLLYAW